MKKMLQLAGILGFQDMRQAYRRSVVGPFWITAAMAVQIGTITIVFGLIFKNPLEDYLPFVATSITLWGFISNTLTDSCMSFVNGEAIVKQLRIPILMHVLRTIWKNCLTLAHNLVILPVAFLIVMKATNFNVLFLLPGLILLLVNLAWMATILAFLSARFRDVPPIVASLMMILVNVTPVFWYPKSIGDAGVAHLLIGLNPFYHLLQIVRLPVLGEIPTLENWLISLGLATIGAMIAWAVHAKYARKVALWV